MSGYNKMVDPYTTDELQLVLDSVYDSELFEELCGYPEPLSDLACAAQMDSTLQRYLLHLNDYDWDKTAAALSWREKV